jgi:hypothetical protein
MPTSRDRVIQTLNHQPVDRAPRDLWIAPGVDTLHADEVRELLYRYPNDIVKPDFPALRGQRAKGTPHEVGEYTDAWGCVWRVPHRGTMGELRHSPLADLGQLAQYRLPWELLDEASFAEVNRSCANTSQFVLAWSETRPFERLQFLHGAEGTFVDLAHGTRELHDLLGMLHEFSRREMETWAATDVDGVVFMDDWGSQQSLLISPEAWRELFKPLYRDYCEILHRHDKFAFFHSDGYIADIFHDLVEIGVDAINSQLFCMDIESLAEHFRGRVTFWGEIDRQWTLPMGTPAEIRAAVERVRKALDFGRGGLIAQCEWSLGIPFDKIAAVFEAWMQPVLAHA